MSKFGFIKDGEYPRITERLHLRDYNAQFRKWLREQGQEDAYLDIWLNWSREFEAKVQELRWKSAKIVQMPIGDDEQREALLKAQEALMPFSHEVNAEFWGCEPEDVQALYELDVELWSWIVDRANEMRSEYREKRKKAD